MNRACACGAIADIGDDGQFQGGVSHGIYACVGPGVEVHAPDCWHIHHDCAVAAIQRVREFCAWVSEVEPGSNDDEANGAHYATGMVLRALDGPA